MRQKRAVEGARRTPRGTEDTGTRLTLRFEPGLLHELREIALLAGSPWNISAIVKQCVKRGIPDFREMIANGGLVPGNGAKKVA